MSRKVGRKLERQVRATAADRCEYCHLPQVCSRFRHEADHVVAQQHHGPTAVANLALACVTCNRHKGPNLSGIDPTTGRITPLFNPRVQSWRRHFRWRGTKLVGLTETGRSTIDVLRMNGADHVALRRALVDSGEFPRDFE